MLMPHKKHHKGNFVLTTNEGDIFAADELRTTPKGIELSLGGLVVSNIENSKLEDIFNVQTAALPADQILESSKLGATILAVEKIVDLFLKEKELPPAFARQRHFFTIFGASSLSLTVLPTRTSDDIDMVASEEFVDFVNSRDFPWTEMAVEVLDPRILNLMGQWQSRACAMTGYQGTSFEVMHPVDTVMQKLLRMNQEKFFEKDVPDIKAIIGRFHPPEETLKHLLTENPNRYYKVPFGHDDQRTAVEHNTRWFLSNFAPTCSYEDIVQRAVEQNNATVSKVDSPSPSVPLRVESLPDFSISDKIRLVQAPELKNDLRVP